MWNDPMFFQILCDHEVLPCKVCKASVFFVTPHKWGNLNNNCEGLGRTGELQEEYWLANTMDLGIDV